MLSKQKLDNDIGNPSPPLKCSSRKFSGAGFTLGGRCGSLAVGASLQGRLYGWRPRELALKAGYPRRQGPDVNPQRKISGGVQHYIDGCPDSNDDVPSSENQLSKKV